MLIQGPVRTPDDARPGKATVRVAFPLGHSFRSVPTDIPVELVRPKGGK